MNRHMQQIDHQTGEVVEGFCGLCCSKAQKNGFQKGWMAMAQEAMMMLAQSNLTEQRHEGYVGNACPA